MSWQLRTYFLRLQRERKEPQQSIATRMPPGTAWDGMLDQTWLVTIAPDYVAQGTIDEMIYIGMAQAIDRGAIASQFSQCENSLANLYTLMRCKRAASIATAKGCCGGCGVSLQRRS
jgi:hypothetical protein